MSTAAIITGLEYFHAACSVAIHPAETTCPCCGKPDALEMGGNYEICPERYSDGEYHLINVPASRGERVSYEALRAAWNAYRDEERVRPFADAGHRC